MQIESLSPTHEAEAHREANIIVMSWVNTDPVLKKIHAKYEMDLQKRMLHLSQRATRIARAVIAKRLTRETKAAFGSSGARIEHGERQQKHIIRFQNETRTAE